MKANWLWGALAISMAAAAIDPIGASAQPAASKPAPKPGPKGAPKRGKAPVAVSTADVTALSGTDVEAAARAADALGASELPGGPRGAARRARPGPAPGGRDPRDQRARARTRRRSMWGRSRATPGTSIRRSAAPRSSALAMYPSPEAHAIVVGGLRDHVGMVRNAAASAAARGRIRDRHRAAVPAPREGRGRRRRGRSPRSRTRTSRASSPSTSARSPSPRSRRASAPCSSAPTSPTPCASRSSARSARSRTRRRSPRSPTTSMRPRSTHPARRGRRR